DLSKTISDVNINKARALVLVGDGVTTDHISPGGKIIPDSPAGKYLIKCGVKPYEFNSYGSRRSDHNVALRSTFANLRFRNLIVPKLEGGYTKFIPTGETMTIFDAAKRYQKEQIPLIIIAGKNYGTGSSRD